MLRRHAALYSAILLLLSATLLSAMIPGGPVETRDFSHYDPLLLGSFNTFLTVLGLASYGAAWFVMRRRRWALISAQLCGVGYFLVYAADLAQLFPQSPLAMPAALLVMEITGLVVSLPLMLLPALAGHSELSVSNGHRHLTSTALLLITAVTVLAVGIIAFATRAASGHG